MELPLGMGVIEFRDWAKGLLAGFISGGASAVSTGFSVAIVDPEHFSTHTGSGLYHLFEAMAVAFVVPGVLNVMAFLRVNPLPGIKTVSDTTVRVKQPGVPEQVLQVHTESKDVKDEK